MTEKSSREFLTTALHSAIGDYSGEGVNYEQQAFLGQFSLIPCRSGAFLIEYLAMSPKTAEVFYAETSLLAFNETNSLTLWNSKTKNPSTLAYQCEQIGQCESGIKLTFVYGQLEDPSSFRGRIEWDILAKTIRYLHSWGLPSGVFAERYGLTMTCQSESID